VKHPAHWASAPLDAVAAVQLGKMLSAETRQGPNQRPYLRNINVRWGSIDVSDVLTMDFSEEQAIKFSLQPGDLLVCEGGEPGRAAVWENQLPGALYQKALHRVRPNVGVSSRFLLYYLMCATQTSELAQSYTGSTIKHLPKEVLERSVVPLPPTGEQERMVSVLEATFSEIEKSAKELRSSLKRISHYRAAVLKAACEGRLVPTEAKGVTLGEISDIQGGITLGKKRRPEERVRHVPYLRVANVQRGRLDVSEIKTVAATEEEIERLRLIPGDVLFNEGGDRDKLGRGWVWEGQISECIHQNHVFRARIDRTVASPKFVSYYGNSVAQQYFWDEGKHTTNMASINRTKLSALPLALPPLAVQDEIVAEVERRLSVVEQLEAAIARSLHRAARLRHSILKQAFEGKLVPQDPNDEPASVLLERIRVEREKAEKEGAREVTTRRGTRRRSSSSG
jgi:type I restriction enzyme, S subunit